MAPEKVAPDHTPRWEQIWEVFHQAREANPSEPAAYLNGLKNLNQELFIQVEELLEADKNSGDTLQDIITGELNLIQDHTEPEPTAISPNTLLADRFRILRLLGMGGMGTVYEAFDEELKTSVTLKIMRSDLTLSTSARERFHREINIARQITHPGACKIFDLFHHEELLFLTMELLQGETLHEKIQREGHGSCQSIPACRANR